MRTLARKLVVTCALALLGAGFAANALAQDLGKEDFTDLDIKPTDVIYWDPVEAAMEEGNVVTVGLRLRTIQNFGIYKANLKFSGPPGFELVETTAPTTRKIRDPISGNIVDVYYGGEFILRFKGYERFAGDQFPVDVTFLGCTERICLFPFTLELNLKVFDRTPPESAAAPEQPALTPPPEPEAAVPVTEPLNSQSWEKKWSDQLAKGKIGFFFLLVILFLGGLATNLTPCVLPMIPITIRILAHQRHSPFLNAAVYASGIVASYTFLGIVVSFTGGFFGALLGNAYVNLFFAVVFFLFAFSMLGFGNLSVLQKLGTKITTGKPTLINSFFMGVGAGLVAAPCTGPILGALIVYTAGNPELGRAGVQFFTYSLGFALPYLFLGLAANRITRIKVSDAIQVGTKVIFAAVMVALAFYYLRVPAYGLVKYMRPFWPLLTVGGLVVGIVLAVVFTHVLRLEISRAAQVVPAFVMGIGLFAASQWITAKTDDDTTRLNWHKTIEAGVAEARKDGKPILIDGWAEWCEACKKMDSTTFVDPELVTLLREEWVLVKLDLTEMTDENQKTAETYGLQGLPTLVLLPASGDLNAMEKIVGWADAPDVIKALREFKK